MTFLDYLWILCHRPFKRVKNPADSDIYKLMSAVATILEKARSSIYFVRRQFLIATCDETSLLEHGRAYGIPKLDSESAEQYRSRLLAMWDYFRMGGTIPGMLNALVAMGFQTAEIVEHYQIFGVSEWAVFTVEIDLNEYQASPYSRSEVQDEIRRLKPAHTLGAFRMTCLITDSPDGLVDTDLLCL